MTVSFTDDLDALDGAFWVVSNYANPGSWVDTGFSPDRVTVADDVVTLTLDLANYLDKNFTGGEFYTTQEYALLTRRLHHHFVAAEAVFQIGRAHV